MNKKILLSAVAVASILTACTDDDAFAPVNGSASLANRHQVGAVTFTMGETATRFDVLNLQQQNGDKFGAYLMDEYRGYCEPQDANNPVNPLTMNGFWKYQSFWHRAYPLVNYVNSNYGYVKNGANWENPAAQLVEGNYLLMFPQNEAITNRRELWHAFNPNVDLELTNEDTQYHKGYDNYFYLGYNQIYRDDTPSKDGKYQLEAQLHSVVSFAEMCIMNQGATKYEIEKIAIMNGNGKPVPTVAYVQPAAKPMMNDIRDNGLYDLLDYTDEQLIGECGEVLYEDLYPGCYGEKHGFTQADARAITKWTTTADGHIPYNFPEELKTPAYEYNINFPANTILQSHTSTANLKKCQTFAAICLPPNCDEFNYDDVEVVVYAKQWDQSLNKGEGDWRHGVIKRTNVDNSDFTLDILRQWNEGKSMPQVVVKYDDEAFYQLEQIKVSTTEELIKLLQARLSKGSNTENIEFEVTAFGNGLEITDEVVKIIKDYEDKNEEDISVTFKQQANCPIILAAKNCIDEFDFAGVDVILSADQTAANAIKGVNDLMIEATASVKIGADVTVNSIQNEGVLEIAGALVKGELHNMKTATLNNSVFMDNILNDGIMTIVGDVYAMGEKFDNDNDCVNCLNTKAVLNIGKNDKLYLGTDIHSNSFTWKAPDLWLPWYGTIHEGRTFEFPLPDSNEKTQLINGTNGIVNNAGTIASTLDPDENAVIGDWDSYAKYFGIIVNDGEFYNYGQWYAIKMTNNGTIDNRGEMVLINNLTNGGESVNYGTINNSGDIHVYEAGTYGSTMVCSWKNAGTLNALSGSKSLNVNNDGGTINVNAGSKTHIVKDSAKGTVDVSNASNVDNSKANNSEVIDESEDQWYQSTNNQTYNDVLDELTYTTSFTAESLPNLTKLHMSGNSSVKIQEGKLGSGKVAADTKNNITFAEGTNVTFATLDIAPEHVLVAQGATVKATDKIVIQKKAVLTNLGTVSATKLDELGTFNGKLAK